MEKLKIDGYRNNKGKWIFGIFFMDNNAMSILSKSPYRKVIEKRLKGFQYNLDNNMFLDCDKSESIY